MLINANADPPHESISNMLYPVEKNLRRVVWRVVKLNLSDHYQRYVVRSFNFRFPRDSSLHLGATRAAELNFGRITRKSLG